LSLLTSAFNPAGNSANAILTGVPCDATVVVGDFVRMDGGTAIKAIANSLDNSNVLGLVEQVNDDSTCTVRINGVSEPIFSGLDEALEYYLSDSVAGAITVVAPTASGTVVLKLGQPFDTERLIVLKGSRILRL
jgi:hypothetical protein